MNIQIIDTTNILLYPTGREKNFSGCKTVFHSGLGLCCEACYLFINTCFTIE